MARRQPAVATRHLSTLFDVGAIGGLTDRQLLEQFSTGHREMAEAAFTTLVERHGPMVMRVCRGVLGDSHDVQDTFQATFLVLVRKAGSLWVRDSLGPWLHGVAFRVATKAKVAAARRNAHERRAAEAAEARRGGENDDALLDAPRGSRPAAAQVSRADRALLSGGPEPRRSRGGSGLARGDGQRPAGAGAGPATDPDGQARAGPIGRGDRWVDVGERSDRDDALVGVRQSKPSCRWWRSGRPAWRRRRSPLWRKNA